MPIGTFFLGKFTQRQAIAGLEISDTFLRIVLLGVHRKTGAITEQAHAEKKLDPGIIVRGLVRDAAKLNAALSDLKAALPFGVEYAIVSIPSDAVYLKVLPFARSIDPFQLQEGIRLAIDFQLPHKAEDVYASWERLRDPDAVNQQVLLAEAPKKTVDPFIECVRRAFNVVAVEFHAHSIARIAPFEKEEAVLLTIPAQSSTGFFVIKNKAPHFSRILGPGVLPERLQKEPENVKNFYEAETKEPLKKSLNITTDPPLEGLKITFPELQKSNAWLVATGAALRGLAPREEDAAISLLPISTQEAYEYQKAVNYASFLSKLTIVLALFFVAAYAGAWMLMSDLQQNTVAQLSSITATSAPAELVEMEEELVAVNALIATTGELLRSAPQWSILMEELQRHVLAGITIDGMSLPSTGETLSITGVAKDRSTLNQFRDKLKTSTLLTEVDLPLTNLEQKSDISFTISFKLADLTSLYIR